MVKNKVKVPKKESIILLSSSNCMLQNKYGVKDIHAIELSDEEEAMEYIDNNFDNKDYCVVKGKVLKGWLDPYPFD